MSKSEAQVLINEWLRKRSLCLRLGLQLTASDCLTEAKRICAEFKVQRVK